jgi:hypothetical protein
LRLKGGDDVESCPFRVLIPKSTRYMCDSTDELCPLYVRRVEADFRRCWEYRKNMGEGNENQMQA